MLSLLQCKFSLQASSHTTQQRWEALDNAFAVWKAENIFSFLCLLNIMKHTWSKTMWNRIVLDADAEIMPEYEFDNDTIRYTTMTENSENFQF